jgi:hypothetical protein
MGLWLSTMNRRLSSVLELHGVDHPAGDHQVVAVLEVDVAQEGAQGAAALVDEDHLIAVGVLVKVVHAFAWGAASTMAQSLFTSMVLRRRGGPSRLGLEAVQAQRAHVLLDRDLGLTSFGLRSSFTCVGRWVW